MSNGILGQQSNSLRRAQIYLNNNGTYCYAQVLHENGAGYNIAGKLSGLGANSQLVSGSNSQIIGQAGIDGVTFGLTDTVYTLTMENSTVETIVGAVSATICYNDTGLTFNAMNFNAANAKLNFMLWNGATKVSWLSIPANKAMIIYACWIAQSTS